MLIDLGEGLQYPSHPELAVQGSWTPERMKEEIVRLKGLGLEPIPKLNFSACHDAWLKDYSRMVATPEYYKVCADLIRDVCEIFGKPRLFHLGWDEERMGRSVSRATPCRCVRAGGRLGMKFIDTNVFVYFVDRRDMHKQTIARSLIASAFGTLQYSITWQVLNEFANVALAKLSMTEDEVCYYISRFRNIRMQMPKPEWTDRALMIRKQYGIQFYDALIVAAAEASGCDEILTEDLNDGQLYCGIKAVNPFKQ